MNRYDKDLLSSKAHRLLKKMMDKGEIQRPDKCELCGSTPGVRLVEKKGRTLTQSCIVAHHWRGYSEDALTDVWWICNGCSLKLKGDRFHNGSLDRAQVREFLGKQP